jgi:hypothetical protein
VNSDEEWGRQVARSASRFGLWRQVRHHRAVTGHQSCGEIEVDARHVCCASSDDVIDQLPRNAEGLAGRDAEGVERLAVVPKGWSSSFKGLVVRGGDIYYGLSKADGFGCAPTVEASGALIYYV